MEWDQQETDRYATGVDRAESINVRFPTVACVGEPAFLSVLSESCPVLATSSEPRPLEAELLIIDNRSETVARAWAAANPLVPVLLTRERSIDAVSLGHWRIAPPGGTKLKDPARFCAGLVLAADQLETSGSPAMRRRLLTPRELEVLEALAHGMRLKGIAGQLNISENTVKQHIMNARHKLGAPDRITAVLCAIRDGLIPFPAFELK